MSISSSRKCLNCNVENESRFQYCSNCGQKNTDGKITFSELWSEFQDAVFNVESRTWRTLKSLFIPGSLTLEYFTGKHRRYVHPLRLLLVTSVLFIIAMSFQDFQSAKNHAYDVKERMLKNYERQRLFGILSDITDTTNTIFVKEETKLITDTILTAFNDSLRNLLLEYSSQHGDMYGDSIDLAHYVNLGSESTEKLSKYDFLNKDEDELVSIYKKEAGIFERLLFRQKIKYIKDESKLFAAVVGNTTWAFLLMMPCLALVLYLLYLRHNYFYVEHLIFTFHSQSFAFLILAFLVGGMNIIPLWLALTVMLIIWIYLYISMFKVYKQSAGKTLLKFLLLSLSYVVIFIVILLVTLAISFLRI